MKSDAMPVVILATFPDRDGAERAAAALVERRLAACVQINAGCRSLYRWEGRTEQADEVPIAAKCAAATTGKAIAALEELHPYEVPEIIALPMAAGLGRYLSWIDEECGG